MNASCAVDDWRLSFSNSCTQHSFFLCSKVCVGGWLTGDQEMTASYYVQSSWLQDELHNTMSTHGLCLCVKGLQIACGQMHFTQAP